MSIYINYLELFKIFLFIFSVTLCSKLSIDSNDGFPVHVNSSFRLVFESKKTYSAFSVMKLQILNGQSIMSSLLINPGISDRIDNIMNDKYMSVIDWFKDKYNAINLFVKFFAPSHDLTFQVLYYDSETSDNRKKALNNTTIMDKVFSEQIKLLIDPTLEFIISTKDGRKDGVNYDDIAIITCSSKNGVPPGRPILSYVDKLKVKNRRFIENENRIIVHFYVQKSDHDKYVRCSSGGASEYRYIKVFHHPTALDLSPAYSNVMPNGSSVICKAQDGYPTPTVNWLFIKGPPNASNYYVIMGGKLTILPNCPLQSSWTFNCTALNSIPKSYDFGATRMFTFVVSPINAVAGLTLGIVIPIIIIVIIIFILCKKKDLIKKRLSRTPKKSASDKNLNDETPNNFNNSYYTYPVVTSQDTEADGDNIKKKKDKRKPHKEPLVDPAIDDCIV